MRFSTMKFKLLMEVVNSTAKGDDMEARGSMGRAEVEVVFAHILLLPAPKRSSGFSGVVGEERGKRGRKPS